MHRKISVIFLLVVLCLCGCHKADNSNVKHEKVQSKIVSYDSLEDMEDACDLIVTGTRLDSEETVLSTTEGIVTSGSTNSQFEISNVHKDELNTFKEGDVITISECAYYVEAEEVMYNEEDYNMMVPGKKYILFLKNSGNTADSIFYSAGVNAGTVSIENDGRDELTYSNGAKADYSYYKPFWDAAKDKYL